MKTVGTINVGVRASGGALAGRSFGPSLSPEARFGGSSSKFSSKALSSFNRTPIGFKDIGGLKPSKSFININHGKEANSKFNRTPSLEIPKKMFNISKPVVLNPVARPFEFGVKVDTQNGREIKPIKARTQDLFPEKPIIDTNRMPAQNVIFEKKFPVKNTETISKIPINTFRETVIFLKRKDISPRLKLEKTRQIKIDKSLHKERKITLSPKLREKLAITQKKIEKPVDVKTKNPEKTKKERIKIFKRKKVGNALRIYPEVSQLKKKLIYKDIKEAQKILIPAIMKARKVSYEVALTEVVRIIEKKHEGSVLLKNELKTEKKVMPLVKKEIAPKIETKKAKSVNSLRTKVENVASRIINKSKKYKEKYYFTKDDEANDARKKRLKSELDRLSFLQEKGKEITGWEIEGALMKRPQNNEYSEMVRPFKKDIALENLIKTVKTLGYFLDLSSLKDAVDYLVNRNTAVKITEKPSSVLAGEYAEKVYNEPLNSVPAYIGERNKVYKLFASKNTRVLEEVIIKTVRKSAQSSTLNAE